MNIIKSILEISLFSSIIICIVLMLRSVWSGKINHKVLSFLWILVLVRLIMPITIDSPIHLDSIFPKDAAETSVEPIVVEPINEIAVLPEAEYILPNAVIHNLDTTLEVDVVQSSLWSKIASYIKSIDLSIAAFVVWLSVAAFIFILNIAEYFRFNYLVTREKHTRNARLSRTLRRSKAILNINKEISIYECTYISTPATFRCVRSVILVPADFTRHIKDNKLQMIILHELCHIKRGDILKNFIWLLAKSMHWFNPLVWIAYRKYISDMELFCDEMVLKYISEDESFMYSQSLIDVIKLSNSDNQLPVALSFCEDKTKIKERVQNMIEPKKKLKLASITSMLLATIMIIGCFTTACQSTPENRSDDEVEETITQADLPTTDEPQNDVVEEAEEPELRVTDTGINDAGTVTVNIDAKVVLPGDKKITSAKLQRDSFAQEKLDKMINVFFGDNLTFYDHLVTTKADIEGNIAHLEQRLTLDDASLLPLYVDKDMTDVDEIKQHINRIIDELKQKLPNVPEEAPIIPDLIIDEGWGGFQADVDFGKDDLGHVSYGGYPSRPKILCYAFGDENESARFLYPFTSTQIDANTNNPEFATAKEAAQKLIDDMGIDGVQVGDVFISLDNALGRPLDPEREVVVSDREFYVFCFERVVGDRTIDFTFQQGVYTDDNEVSITLPYEDLQVWVEGDKVVKFMWSNPHKITEIVNDNTSLQIDYEQALDLVVNKIFTNYIYVFENEYGESISANITGIEFEMVRVKEMNTDNYIVIPAWKIYGDVQMKLTEEHKSKYNITEDFQSLEYFTNIITINALNGCIIAMQTGY